MENCCSMRYGCYIDGQERDGSRWYPLIDPSTGKEYARASSADEGLVDAAVRSARAAFDGWRSLPAVCRTDLLHSLAARVRSEQHTLAAILCRESGKPFSAAMDEVANAASLMDFFSEEALRLVGEIPLLGYPRQQVLVMREPVGVVGAITPCNYPLSTLACKMGPALAAGCTVVAKPDEHTPLSTLRLGQLATEAGFPPGVFNILTGMGSDTGHFLVEHPLLRMITFTGSSAVGKEIQAICARWVRKAVLELGGHCPAIVCADAPWRNLLPEIVLQCFKNSGQYCYRISRIYAAEEIFEDFLAGLVDLASKLRVGDPMDPEVQLGPLNNADVLAAVQRQVECAVHGGATLETGGAVLAPDRGGYYYPPTVLTGTRSDMSIMREEVFGPVVAIKPFKEIESAIRQANATPYGLAAYLFTENLGNALEWAGRLEMGSVWINRIHQAYPQAPFGGMKESGLGREKSRFGLEEYTELKTIYLSY